MHTRLELSTGRNESRQSLESYVSGLQERSLTIKSFKSGRAESFMKACAAENRRKNNKAVYLLHEMADRRAAT